MSIVNQKTQEERYALRTALAEWRRRLAKLPSWDPNLLVDTQIQHERAILEVIVPDEDDQECPGADEALLEADESAWLILDLDEDL